MPRNIRGTQIRLKGFFKKWTKSWVDREVGVGPGRVGRVGKYDQIHIQ